MDDILDLGCHSCEVHHDEDYLWLWSMGLACHTSSPIDIHEGIHRWILGQIVVFNCFTWFFSLVLIEKAHLAQSFPPIDPPYISTCCNARWDNVRWCTLTKHGICQNHHLRHMHFHIVQCTYLCYIYLNYGANKKKIMLHFISMHCTLNKILTVYF